MRAFLLLTRVQVLGLVNSLAPVRSGLSRSQRRGRIALIACGFALLAIIMMPEKRTRTNRTPAPA